MFSKIYRFTPPTCTLEIIGKRSPLSRWQSHELLDRIKFQLSFDDPRLPSDRQVTIKGNRQDLEQLQTVVNDYLENFLHASFANKERSSFNTTKYQQNNLHLRSTGLVSQELFLGSLNCDRNIEKIELSTTQLFDLVTALQAYDNQISVLPKLDRSGTKLPVALWASVAAGLILAVGVANTLLQTSSVQNVAKSPQPESPTPIPQLDEVVPPSASQRAKKTFQPKPNKNLSSTKRLPPPPAVDTPKPKPNIPDPADYPLSKVARKSDLNSQNGQTESIIIIPPDANKKPAKSDFGEPKNNNQTTSEVSKKDKDRSGLLESSNDLTINSENSPVTAAKPVKELSQIEQVRVYFSSRWQPPADLKQSLEYRLYLNADGSIKKVVPIGKAAKLYLSKTSIPLRGEAFIAPVTKSQSSKIRLLLNPDGGVKVFTEQ